jgi:hypothetical protein
MNLRTDKETPWPIPRTNVIARRGNWFKEWPSCHADAVNFKIGERYG